MAIEGVSHSTVIALVSEIGYEGIKKFETPKQFSSWLRLSPNTKKTGGKVISSHLPKGSIRIFQTSSGVLVLEGESCGRFCNGKETGGNYMEYDSQKASLQATC